MEYLKHFVTIVLSTPKRITSDFIFKSFSCQKKKKKSVNFPGNMRI